MLWCHNVGNCDNAPIVVSQFTRLVWLNKASVTRHGTQYEKLGHFELFWEEPHFNERKGKVHDVKSYLIWTCYWKKVTFAGWLALISWLGHDEADTCQRTGSSLVHVIESKKLSTFAQTILTVHYHHIVPVCTAAGAATRNTVFCVVITGIQIAHLGHLDNVQGKLVCCTPAYDRTGWYPVHEGLWDEGHTCMQIRFIQDQHLTKQNKSNDLMPIYTRSLPCQKTLIAARMPLVTRYATYIGHAIKTGPFWYRKKRLIARSHQASNPQEWVLTHSHWTRDKMDPNSTELYFWGPDYQYSIIGSSNKPLSEQAK